MLNNLLPLLKHYSLATFLKIIGQWGIGNILQLLVELIKELRDIIEQLRGQKLDKSAIDQLISQILTIGAEAIAALKALATQLQRSNVELALLRQSIDAFTTLIRELAELVQQRHGGNPDRILALIPSLESILDNDPPHLAS